MNRREFLQFLGTTGTLSSIAGCGHFANFSSDVSLLESLPPSLEDKLLTLPGINSHVLLRWGDQLHQGKYFGYNNDFIALHKLNHDHYVMWVNHEYVNPLFVSGIERTKSHIDLERKEVGGSIVEIKRTDGIWKTIKDSPYNRRIDGTTPIPFAWKDKISGSHSGIGTLGNCAGGKTPWGTFLTCEENYDMFYGDRDRKGKKLDESWLKWDKFYPLPPEHYGWVVEINPKTGESKKLISLGRCAHECAAVTKAKNGKIVAYTGDDSNDEHLYKFISDSDHSLDQGKLYVANLERREWISLQREDHQILLKNFKDQTEIQIYAREAAKLVGATPLARPEDIEFDPLTGDVLIALTNNKPKNNFHGSILKISEHGNDPGSLKFSYDTFLTGGENQGFSCPESCRKPEGHVITDG
jgi:secreted PhoX family phosphatase